MFRSQMTERGAGPSLAEITAAATSATTSATTVHGVQVVTGQSRLLGVRTCDGGHLLPQLQLQGQVGDPPVQQPHRVSDEQQGDQAEQELV